MFLCLALVVAFVAAAEDAHAASRRNYFSKSRTGQKRWNISLDAGVMYFAKYNQVTTIQTPPSGILLTGNLNLFYKKSFGMYVYAAISSGADETQLIGGGIKLPFLHAQGDSRGSLIGGISMMFVLDAAAYSSVAPVAPNIYTNSTLVLRYGGMVSWAIGSGGFHLNTTMMVTTVSGNFFINPYIGLGYFF